MKARAVVQVRCGSSADATQVALAIESTLVGKSIFARDTTVTATVVKGQQMVVADIRFDIQSEGRAWFDDIIAKWTSGGLRNRFLAGSRVSFHVCPHDEGAESRYRCDSPTVAGFLEAVKA